MKRTVTAPFRAGDGSDACAVEIRDRSARQAGEERERGIARPVLGDDHPGCAGCARPRGLRRVRAATPADERDRAVEGGVRKCGGVVAQQSAHAVDPPDVDEALVGRDPGRRDAVRRRERDPPDASRRHDRKRRPEDVSVRDGAHADRVGRGRRRARRAEAEEVTIVSGRDDRDDARPDDVRHGLDEDVRARIGLRATAREVDDVHAVLHGCLERGHDLRAVGRAAAAQGRRRRHVEDAVVPDIRARRDALEALHRRMTASLSLVAHARSTGLDVGRNAGDDPGHVRPVERDVTVQDRSSAAGPGETAGDDHFLRRAAAGPLRIARRVREACRVQEGMLVVDTVVHDRDLDALAPCSREPGECGAPSTSGPRFSFSRYE